MKTLLLVLLLSISTYFFAQDKELLKPEVVNDHAEKWMTNISTNPQLRLKMMQMMIKQTADQPDMMRLLVDQILSSAEMKIMIEEASSHNTKKLNKTVYKPAKMKKYNNVMKKTAPQKKPKIKN